MDRIAYRLGFLITVLFTLTIFALTPALADEQWNEDTEQSAETTVSASNQVAQAEAEDPGFLGSVGNFIVGGYSHALSQK